MTGLTALFNGPYEEALALVVEARDYVAYRSDIDQKRLAPGIRLQASFESLRMTARLTQVMAWLLAQKALYAGEITLAEMASDQFALGGEHICCDNNAANNSDLPGRLRGLLDRSHRLYQRVARLDRQVRRAANPSMEDATAPNTDNIPGDHSALYAALNAGPDNAAGDKQKTSAAPVVSIASRRPHPSG